VRLTLSQDREDAGDDSADQTDHGGYLPRADNHDVGSLAAGHLYGGPIKCPGRKVVSLASWQSVRPGGTGLTSEGYKYQPRAGRSPPEEDEMRKAAAERERTVREAIRSWPGTLRLCLYVMMTTAGPAVAVWLAAGRH